MTGFNVPQGVVILTANSSSTTGAGLSATIQSSVGTVGRTIYLTGISYQSTGATAAVNVTLTVSYYNSSTSVTLNTFLYSVSGNAGATQSPLIINLDPPIYSPISQNGIASGAGPNIGAINVSVSAPGAGATANALNIWGYAL